MPVFGVIMVRIFPHSDWIRRDTDYLSVFSPNMGICGQNNSEYGHFLRSACPLNKENSKSLHTNENDDSWKDKLCCNSPTTSGEFYIRLNLLISSQKWIKSCGITYIYVHIFKTYRDSFYMFIFKFALIWKLLLMHYSYLFQKKRRKFYRSVKRRSEIRSSNNNLEIYTPLVHLLHNPALPPIHWYKI